MAAEIVTLFTVPNIITGSVPLSLSLLQLYIDSEHDDKQELVIKNFSLAARSARGFKLIVTAYQAIRVKGSEFFGAACWFDFVLQSGIIWFHLVRNNKAWARVTNIGMPILMAAGTSFLFLQYLFPSDHPWHTIVVPVINTITVPLEAIVQLFIQFSNFKSDMKLGVEAISYMTIGRDLLLKIVETSINIYRWNNFAQQIHDKSGADKILSQVGGNLALPIGVIQFGWIICKSFSILHKKTTQVSTGQERQATGVATKPIEEGNTEEHVTWEEGMDAEVVTEAASAEEHVTGEEDVIEVAIGVDNTEEHVMGEEENATEVAIRVGNTKEHVTGEEENAAEVVIEVGNMEEHVKGGEENATEVAIEVEEDENVNKQVTKEGVEMHTASIVFNTGKWLEKIYRVLVSGEEQATTTAMDVGVEMVEMPSQRG